MAKKILAVDGGGIKGVLPAAFLASIEATSGRRIVDHFDLIAGTSTGGIIALGIGLGLPARTILELYVKDGPRIFDQEASPRRTLLSRLGLRVRKAGRTARHLISSKYDAAQLRASLTSVWGSSLLGDSQTRLVIPAFDRNRRELHVFKTAHHERFATDWTELAVDVALGTAAAPTYLPAHTLATGVSCVDGGVWANNPVGLAAVEAIGVLGWAREDLFVLSLGCTDEVFSVPERTGAAGCLRLIELLMLGQSRSAIGTAKLLTGHSETDQRLFRYDQAVPVGAFGLDAVDRIETLRGMGQAMAREAGPEVMRVFLQDLRDEFVPLLGRRRVQLSPRTAGVTK